MTSLNFPSVMASSIIANAARRKNPAQFLSRGVSTRRDQAKRLKRTPNNKFSNVRGRFIFANTPLRPTTPPASQQKIKYTSQNINGNNNPIFYETKKHLQENVNSAQNVHHYKGLLTGRVLFKPTNGSCPYAKMASNYSTLAHKRYYYTEEHEKTYRQQDDVDDISDDISDDLEHHEQECPIFDIEQNDNECVLNVYIDTEQTKIQERNNFVQFLEELAESDEANIAIRSKICTFLASNQYETLLYAKL